MLDVREDCHRFDNYDEFDIWFIIAATGSLDSEFKDFEILDIKQYDSKPNLKNSLSNAFIPKWKIDDLDRIAEDFLHKYYPEILKTPGAINVDKLVERLGLIKMEEYITADGSVFGRIYFRDREEEIYNSNGQISGKRSIKAGTILTDPQVFFLRNLGAVNNTVIHECVHWIFHRKYFEFERLFDTKITQIDCRVIGGLRGLEKWSNTDVIEWQANALTPRIQMPLKLFKKKAEEFIHKYREEFGSVPIIDVMEHIITDLADLFVVSKMSVKIRMKELGYEEAAGTFIWLDGHYVKAHNWKKGFLKDNQTFSIGEEDIVQLCSMSGKLRDDKRTGRFIYVDSHLVLNLPQYVEQDVFGDLQLTNYARTHMDECCIVFEMSLCSDMHKTYHTECFLNRDRDANIALTFQYHNGLENSNDERKDSEFLDMLDRENKMLGMVTQNYVISMKNLMEFQGMDYNQIAEEINVVPRTVKRVITGESGTVERLSAICLSMQLPPAVSHELIRTSKWNLDITDKKHQVLKYALEHMYNYKFDKVRAFLHKYEVQI